MNTRIRSSECAWQHSSLTFMGRRIDGLRGWNLNVQIEKEPIYAAGSEPHDISEGNVSYSGSITVLGYELDAMDRAAVLAGYDSICRVPHELQVMVVKMQKTLADPLVIYTVRGISFEGQEDKMSQNDKNREIELTFKAMSISKTVV